MYKWTCVISVHTTWAFILLLFDRQKIDKYRRNLPKNRWIISRGIMDNDSVAGVYLFKALYSQPKHCILFVRGLFEGGRIAFSWKCLANLIQQKETGLLMAVCCKTWTQIGTLFLPKIHVKHGARHGNIYNFPYLTFTNLCSIIVCFPYLFLNNWIL